MMRYGKPLGTLDWETDVVHLMGSERSVITESVRKSMLETIENGDGIVGLKEKSK